MKENNYVKDDDDDDDDGTERIIKIMKIYRITKLTEGSKREIKGMRKRKEGVRRIKIFIHTTHLHPTNEQTKKLKDFCSGRHVYEEKWKHEKESKTFFSFSSSSSS